MTRRYCSYCSEPTHTVRTCSLKAQQLADAETANAKARKEIVSTLKEMAIGVGSLVELLYFKSLRYDEVSTDLFYVESLAWPRINQSLLDTKLPQPLQEYFYKRSIVKSNHANLILVNPEHPAGLSISFTLEKLNRMKRYTDIQLDMNIGDFIIHDGCDWSQTENTIPSGFFEGKFFKNK